MDSKSQLFELDNEDIISDDYDLEKTSKELKELIKKLEKED